MMKIMLKRFLLFLLCGTFIAVLLLVSIQPYVPAYAEEPEAECWAVIVGVSDYKIIGDLNYSDDGAKKLFHLLSPAWGKEHIKLLLDSKATKAEIRKAVEWLVSNEDANDTVLFYFAGHGDPGGYIAPYDAYYEPTWISSRELSSWLHPLDSKRVIIILDTCHAGKFETDLSDSGRVVLMSSRSNEYSWETTYLEHGVFTYYLLEALSEFSIADDNFDYELSAEEIFYYAEPETALETSDFEKTQHPVMSDQYAGELSLLVQFIFSTEPDLPSGFNILILDNEEYSSVPLELTWAPGSVHDITLISPIDTGKGTRYVFISWDDGNTSVSRTISGGGAYTANLKTQYELVIESAFGEPEGQGWYDEGSTATISVTSVEGPTTKHIFTRWSGNYSGTEATASITMDSPKTITANWRTEYLLTIESEHGQPEGGGWYESGSTATISAPSITGLGIRYIFTGWSGDYSGTEATASITMDSPKTITTNWRADFTQLFIFIGVLVVAGGATVIVLMMRRRKAVAPARIEGITPPPPPTPPSQPPAARFCGKCGNKIEPGDAFCTQCGKAVEE